MKKELVKKFGSQASYEFASAYLYLSMAMELDETGFHGMADWMRIQSEEEVLHGLAFIDFLRAQGLTCGLSGIDAPSSSGKTPVAVFEVALSHEKSVTAMIRRIADDAESDKDYTAVDFAVFMLKEQIDEERQVRDIIDKLRAGDSASALFIDAELAKRKPGSFSYHPYGG